MERSLPQRGKFYEVSSLISQLAPRFIVEVVDSAGHGKVILKRPNGNVPFMVTEDQWNQMNPFVTNALYLSLKPSLIENVFRKVLIG